MHVCFYILSSKILEKEKDAEILRKILLYLEGYLFFKWEKKMTLAQLQTSFFPIHTSQNILSLGNHFLLSDYIFKVMILSPISVSWCTLTEYHLHSIIYYSMEFSVQDLSPYFTNMYLDRLSLSWPGSFLAIFLCTYYFPETQSFSLKIPHDEFVVGIDYFPSLSTIIFDLKWVSLKCDSIIGWRDLKKLCICS